MVDQQDIQQAIQLYQNGNINHAKQVLNSYISHFPEDINANLLSAAISASENDFSTVVKKCKKVLKVEPGNINACYNAAVASEKLQNYQDVLLFSSQLLQNDLNNVPALLLHIRALCAHGKPAECIAFINTIPETLVLSTPAISMKLAECYMAVSDNEQALRIFRNNIAANINVAECFHNIGIIMDRQDKINNAIQAYQSAVSIAPDSLPSNYNLAFVLDKSGNKSEALKVINRCFDINDSVKVRQAFVQILSTASAENVDKITEKHLLNVMADMETDAQKLSSLVIMLLKHKYQVIHALCTKAKKGHISDLIEYFQQDINEIKNIKMLPLFLINLPIVNYNFECFTIMLRQALLLHISNEGVVSEEILDLCSAMAIHCYINGYVFTVTVEEKNIVSSFLEAIDNNNKKYISAICMYESLYDLHKKNNLNINSSDYKGVFSKLIKLQLDDNLTEEKLYNSISCQTEIKDETSLIVQKQYEGNPYPVWQTLSVRQPESIAEIIRPVQAYSDKIKIISEEPDVLIAGCGTGSHALQSAMRIKNKTITAIDLSRRSLAFAKRKAVEYKLEHINFRQLDILQVSNLNKKYDLIESVGVLHHMQVPVAGLKCLVDILKPGGLMNIGLYSKLGKRYIIKAKSIYDDPNRHISDDEIRQLRVAIMNSDDDELVQNISGYKDFYSLHDCRDLIFHENDNNYDISGLAALMEEAGLEFIAFDLPDHSILPHFRTMFPDNGAQSKIQNWAEFEEKYPDTFSSMYVFWCRKPG